MKKFEHIYNDLENKIKSGFYPVGAYLPGEHDLAKQYQVSRETIRKAQRNLIEKGLVQKQRGRGSLVIEHDRYDFPISGIISYKELQTEQHIPSVTEVIVNETIPAPSFLVGYDSVTEEEMFHHIIRSRVINGEVSIIDEDYIRCSVVEKIDIKIAENSLYEYFEGDLGLVISYATKEIVAEKTNNLDIEQMGLVATDFVIKVSSYVHLYDTKFFQYTVSRHRLEKFRFAEFARRKSNM